MAHQVYQSQFPQPAGGCEDACGGPDPCATDPGGPGGPSVPPPAHPNPGTDGPGVCEPQACSSSGCDLDDLFGTGGGSLIGDVDVSLSLPISIGIGIVGGNCGEPAGCGGLLAGAY